MTADEENEALIELKSLKLIAGIQDAYEKIGIVGEETNRLIGYFAAISRLLEKPLATLFQSRSAAGKSTLMFSVLAFVPDEHKSILTVITPQALYYMAEKGVSHMILAFPEEEGAAQAQLAIKTMQSEKELKIAYPWKDPVTGETMTKEKIVKGPVAFMMCTTKAEIDHEILNRFLVLTSDESKEQTKKIHEKQREKKTLSGYMTDQMKEKIIKKQQNMQRLLKKTPVVIPKEIELTFNDTRLRARRDYEKLLVLVEAVTLLHQYQREIKHMQSGVEYIEATEADAELAKKLFMEVLLSDDMAPQTKKLYEHIRTYADSQIKKQGIRRGDFRFTLREIREHINWSHSQVYRHIQQLIELEYISVYNTGNGKRQSYAIVDDLGSSKKT